nr:DUF1513 domain-containing protein [Hyphomicrobiales bacterium]
KGLSFSLRGYISSVAVDSSGETAAVTSSHGNRVLFLDITTGKLLAERRIADISGVACSGESNAFLLTSGDGTVLAGTSPQAEGRPHPNQAVHWDNHAVKL